MGNKKSVGVQLKKMIPGYAFAAPGVIFVAVYMGYPLIRSLYLSFTFTILPLTRSRYSQAFPTSQRCFPMHILWIL